MTALLEFDCPSCRRLNEVGPSRFDDAQCSRCGCELGALALVRAAADARVRCARAALDSGAAKEAERLATESWALQTTRGAAACGFLAAVLQGDAGAIARWGRRLG